MRTRKETLALLITAALVVLVIGAMYLNVGWQTAPVMVSDEQNGGTNAPSQTVQPIGVTEERAQP